jgi:hypothetical protein
MSMNDTHTIKLHKDIGLKDGTKLPKGTVLEFVKPSAEFSNTVGIFNWKGRDIKMRYRSIIKVPSNRALFKWGDNGICQTVFGNDTEPDGYGPHGEPSWLLAMGMI